MLAALSSIYGFGYKPYLPLLSVWEVQVPSGKHLKGS